MTKKTTATTTVTTTASDSVLDETPGKLFKLLSAHSGPRTIGAMPAGSSPMQLAKVFVPEFTAAWKISLDLLPKQRTSPDRSRAHGGSSSAMASTPRTRTG